MARLLVKKKKTVTILSTPARDTIRDKVKRTIREQPGGPALYLIKVFRREKIPFVTRLAPVINVEILVTKTKEIGRVTSPFRSTRVEFGKIKTPFLVVSTLLDEFSLDGIAKFKGQTFLDVQGYVRDGHDFGVKKNWTLPKKLYDSFYCLKGTAEELSYLPPELVRRQKQKALVCTKGADGVELFYQGQRYLVRPSRVIKANHTVGAGDTLFAFLISRYARTQELLDSVSYAVAKTSDFLAKRAASGRKD